MTLETSVGSSEKRLKTLFMPGSICVIGASPKRESISGRPLRILQKHGFKGELFAVNPKYSEVLGVTCYRSVDLLPSVPDVAIVAVTASKVPAILEECGRKGVRHAIVISSGFEEDDSADAIVRRLREVTNRYDMLLVGPNSEGVWSVPHRAMMTFGSAALIDEVLEGPVSVISQSGSIGGSTARSLQARGIGCRFFISAGNETTTTAADYIDFIVSDGGSSVILLFLEGIRDGQRFLAAADRARRAGIVVVALKAGSSEVGMAAAASHTGKITSAPDVYSHMFEQAGVIEVTSIANLVDAAAVFTMPNLAVSRADVIGDGQPGIALVAPGATRTVMADLAERIGVPLAQFGEATVARISQLIPSYGSADNPVDVTAQVSTSGHFREVLELMGRDDATEALVIQWGNRGTRQIDAVRKTAREIRDLIGKPVFVGFLGDPWELTGDDRHAFRESGLGCGATPSEVLHQLGWLYQKSRRLIEPAFSDSTAAPIKALPRAGGWEDIVPLLANCGFLIPSSVTFASSASESVLRRELRDIALRWPVVVKAHPDALAHKSDRGLVATDVANENVLLETLRDFRLRAPDVDSYLVQEQVASAVEALVTVRQDPDFGPVLTLGVGGRLVELIRDVRHVALPASRLQIMRALHGTRLGTLLSGVRGSEPGDMDALVDAVVALGAVYPRVSETVQEIELNPVIVGPKGKGVWVVDLIATSRSIQTPKEGED